MRAKARGAERAKERRAADARRRAAMFWMLREAGASYGEIARAAGLSRSRVHQICQSYAYQLHRRSEYLHRQGAIHGAPPPSGRAPGRCRAGMVACSWSSVSSRAPPLSRRRLRRSGGHAT